MTSQTTAKTKTWIFKREVNISMVIQILMLASLVLSSWINLQKQLCIVQHDVDLLLKSQTEISTKLEGYQSKVVAWDYRLESIENDFEILRERGK